jgi:CheY-like chemotaxis protein
MPRILVLDDNTLISALLEEWLAELGCEVAGPAESVARALRIIDETIVHGAFLDISVGDGNSYPVADVLHQRAVPFAFATGGGMNDIEARFAAAPVVTKPYDFEDIKSAVDRMLGPRG